MIITYKNRKIERICTDKKSAEKNYGKIMAEKIQQRIVEISATDSVDMMLRYHVGRCHLLRQDRKGQYAVDLVNPYRLVFEIYDDEIQIANILEVVDYH